jgi:hypothetical protein
LLKSNSPLPSWSKWTRASTLSIWKKPLIRMPSDCTWEQCWSLDLLVPLISQHKQKSSSRYWRNHYNCRNRGERKAF